MSFLSQALAQLEKNDVLTYLSSASYYHDEPDINLFRADVKTKYVTEHKNPVVSNCYGSSFFSRQTALSKCLGEAIERYSLFHPSADNKIVTGPAKDIPHSINLSEYLDTKSQNKQITWVEGVDWLHSQKTHIPYALIYLDDLGLSNVNRKFPEQNSSGAAGGFDFNSTLLNAIYELIERDAFMTMYLAKIPPARVIFENYSRKIKYIFDQAKKYRFSINVFDITNDVGVPTYMTILLDEFSNIPITFGLSSGLNHEETIIKSIEESFLGRIAVRLALTHNTKYVTKSSTGVINRALSWTLPNMIENIQFILSTKKKVIFYKRPVPSRGDQLARVRTMLINKNYSLYYVDIKNNITQLVKYHVIKAVIPQLQPLYLDEKNMIIKNERMKTVSGYFHKKVVQYNEIPHPFL